MSKISLSKQWKAGINCLFATTAVITSSTTWASEAHLDCIQLEQNERKELMTLTLELSIQNAEFNAVKQDALDLMSFVEGEISSLSSSKCQQNIILWNLSSERLTKMTTEEIKSSFEERKQELNQHSSCAELTEMLAASAMILSMADNNKASKQARAEMKAVLNNAMLDKPE